jgi:hypothetical protein
LDEQTYLDCRGVSLEVGDTVVFGRSVRAGTLHVGVVKAIKPRFKHEWGFDKPGNWTRLSKEINPREADVTIEIDSWKWLRTESGLQRVMDGKENTRVLSLDNIAVVEKGRVVEQS